MIKWYFSLLGVVIVCLVILIVQFGLNPKPKPIIKPSNFTQFGMIGKTIYRQLHKEIHLFKIVAFGVHHHTNLDIILDLLSTSKAYKHPFHTVLILNHLQANPLKSKWQRKTKDTSLSDLQVKYLSDGNYQSVLQFLKDQQSSFKKTLMIANPEDVFHLQKQSLIQFLESDLSLSILSFIHVECELDLEKIQELQKFCRQQTKKTSSFSHLSCLAYQKSTWLKRLKTKKINKDKNIIFLEQYGLLDYIYFTYIHKDFLNMMLRDEEILSPQNEQIFEAVSL